jgi:Na+-translocating ferredoxin:NAD+ oxidoreductase subunit D
MAERIGRGTAAGFTLAPAPHLRTASSAAAVSWLIAASLLPAAAWGIFLFGLPALLVLACSLGAALVVETLSSLAFHRFTLHDGSGFLTGLFVGMLMPPGVPLYVPAAAAAFAVLVIKQSFGGLGRNWMNPALGGIVFALLSWSEPMSRWLAARGTDMSPALPPLEAFRAALAAPGTATSAAPAGNALTVLGAHGYPFSAIDGSIVSWINMHLLAPLHLALPAGVFDILVGIVPGRIGEVSPVLIMAGAAFLLARRLVRWEVPVVYIATFAVLAQVFGGLPAGRGWLAGSAIFHILSGSLVLGAFFMAGDPVTSPLVRRGRYIYAAGLGVLTFFLRFFGSLGDGVAVAIVLGNCAVPFIDKVTQRRTQAAVSTEGRP